MEQDYYSIPIGLKIERLRRIMEISQETLANKLGMSRQLYSRMIQSNNIDDEKLNQIAIHLGIKPEIIKNFSEESVFNYIQNNEEGSNPGAPYVFGSNNTIHVNALDKVVQLFEEKERLYEQLLKSEREKIALLEARLNEKKG